jgi:DNA-binding MarR family transcriptional regulator
VTRPATVPAGRSLPAELTQEGRAMLKRTEAGIRAAEDRVLAPLNERDQRDLRRILAALG